MDQIISPTQLPKFYGFGFVKYFDDFPNSKSTTYESYIVFIQRIESNEEKLKLKDYFRFLEVEYENFLSSIGDNTQDFIPLEDIKKKLTHIELEIKTGDITHFELYYYYYVFTDLTGEKRISKMKKHSFSNSITLPEEALTMIKERKIHSYKDYKKFYDWRRIPRPILSINIPSKYYPDQLVDVLPETGSPFYFTNSDLSALAYDGNLEAPRIPLDIGDGYILYVAPLAEYNKYFFRKAEIKI